MELVEINLIQIDCLCKCHHEDDHCQMCDNDYADLCQGGYTIYDLEDYDESYPRH